MESEVRGKPQREEVMKIQEGTIMKSTWGYDQTNVDFFKVTKVNKRSIID